MFRGPQRGHPEVRQEDPVVVLVQQDVGRLHVAVDHAALVHVGQRIGHRDEEVEGRTHRQPLHPLQAVGEGLPRDVPEHGEGQVVLVEGAVAGHDVWMGQVARDPRLTPEPFPVLQRLSLRRIEELEGHVPALVQVPAQQHHAHPPARDQPPHFVPAPGQPRHAGPPPLQFGGGGYRLRISENSGHAGSRGYARRQGRRRAGSGILNSLWDKGSRKARKADRPLLVLDVPEADRVAGGGGGAVRGHHPTPGHQPATLYPHQAHSAGWSVSAGSPWRICSAWSLTATVAA